MFVYTYQDYMCHKLEDCNGDIFLLKKKLNLHRDYRLELPSLLLITGNLHVFPCRLRTTTALRLA
jgi:hypothetical protein